METSHSGQVKRTTLPTIALLCVLVGLGYVLSAGPVSWAMGRGYLPEPFHSAIRALYFPVACVAQSDTRLGDLLLLYASLW